MNVLRFILKMSQPYRLFLWGMVACITFVGIDQTVKPYLIKEIIDHVSNGNYNNVWFIVGIYAAFQVCLISAWFMFDWFNIRTSPQMTSHIIKSLTNEISDYAYSFFQNKLSGSISAKISDAAKRIPFLLTQQIIIYFIQTLIIIAASIFLLGTVHYLYAVALCIWLIIFFASSYMLLKKANSLSAIEAETDSKTWGRIVDYFVNIFTIKIFSSRKYEENKLNSQLNTYIDHSIVKSKHLRTYFTVQGSIFTVYIMLCLCSMIIMSRRGLITAGDFALVFMLNNGLISWLFHISSMLNEFIASWGTIGQALEIIDLKPEVQDKPHAKQLLTKQAEIKFQDVQFNYKDAESLFQNKSITIHPGTKVGLVGYSGGGKTTFVHLILRLFDVTSGAVLIDGQDIRDVTQDSLRSSIGMIPQDPTLFHRSLFDNIHYGNLNATYADVIAAAKNAHADEFINKLPHGYDSLVGERGVKLSGGQRQRIAIARVMLKNAPILILDEATSQLDSITENEIQGSLWKLMQDKTTIVIAHRLSTLMHMDRILVFDKGKIVEDGSHQELLAKKGLYKTLWDTQVGGFILDQPNSE